MDYESTNQSSTTNLWYIIGAIVIIALVAWYFYAPKSPTENTQPTAVEQTQGAPVSSGNTTADINAELNQIQDNSAGLDQAAAASASAVQAI